MGGHELASALTAISLAVVPHAFLCFDPEKIDAFALRKKLRFGFFRVLARNGITPLHRIFQMEQIRRGLLGQNIGPAD
jgi:hypothetical protein